MNILVLLSGIADPKWPMPQDTSPEGLAKHRSTYPLLSPFDEAALELALKLRENDSKLKISVLVCAHSRIDALMRHVASFRMESVHGLDTRLCPAWNSAALAQALAKVMRDLQTLPDLVLVGREFGDLDDSSLPATLAESMQLPFVSQVLGINAKGEDLEFLRQQGAGQEFLRQPLPVLAAVTNHSRNRLRHPLLKNVMASKKMEFDLLVLEHPEEEPGIQLEETHSAQVPTRTSACQFLQGDTASQAHALAAMLTAQGDAR
jgi:electron transfer flavoprotein beta subunit